MTELHRQSDGPGEAVPPTLDPLLASWLRAARPGCPRCGYDLSAAERPQCPECGFPLALRVGVADPATLPWTLVLVLLALPPGLAALMSVGEFLHAASRGGRPALHNESLRVGLVATGPLLAWILTRRRFVRLEPGPRRVMLVVFVLIGLVECLLSVNRL